MESDINRYIKYVQAQISPLVSFFSLHPRDNLGTLQRTDELRPIYVFMICSALAASLDTEYSIGRYNRGERGGGRLNGGWTAGTSPTRADWEFGHIAEEARADILDLSAIMNRNFLYVP